MPVYRVTKSFSTRTPRSERVLALAEAFGLGLEEKAFHIFRDLPVEINQGDVVYITGQSGSGKSQLLRELASQMTDNGLMVADIDQVELSDVPLIDQVGETMQDAIEILSRAGINDAYLAIRRPQELSDGQRYRLRLAKLLMNNSADVWIADEFGAILDRVTAKAVAFNAQKFARSQGKTLMVATTHTDITDELAPNLRIEKRFQDRVEMVRRDTHE